MDEESLKRVGEPRIKWVQKTGYCKNRQLRSAHLCKRKKWVSAVTEFQRFAKLLQMAGLRAGNGGWGG